MEDWDIQVADAEEAFVDDFQAISDDADALLDTLELAYGTEWAYYFVAQIGWAVLLKNREDVVRFVSWLYDPTTEIPVA